MTTPHTSQPPHEAFGEAQAQLRASRAVLLTTHERTDGDDLATVLSLAHALRAQGKTVVIAIKGGVPPQLAFLPGSELVIEAIPENFYPDTVIVSGCSTLDRTGLAGIRATAAPIINFDHHPDNTSFGNINVTNPGASAVALLAYEFLQYCNWPITFEIATCILTGLITDTGSFLHSNTDTITLQAAGDLMRRGARTARITKHAYHSTDKARLAAWSRALSSAWHDETKGMVCSVLTEEDLRELGSPPLAVFEGVVETLNKVPEARFAMLLKQDGAVIKGSLRSDPHKQHGGVDVGKLARLLGGGGHRYAAGFTVPGILKRLANNRWHIEAAPPRHLIPE